MCFVLDVVGVVFSSYIYFFKYGILYESTRVICDRVEADIWNKFICICVKPKMTPFARWQGVFKILHYKYHISEFHMILNLHGTV